ncbi:hypothetical protein K4F52_008235 [Lecanicillium sp. MT-2017a]|nr:hypothetical protein K4F52_008235 [Lecanicillium sp. MT-2017a]
MKFAHSLKETLASQDFPDHWVAQAIPYGQLKKCLKKVQRELQDLGLDQETLRALLDANAAAPVALQYKLRASNRNAPKSRPSKVVNRCDTNIDGISFERACEIEPGRTQPTARTRRV